MDESGRSASSGRGESVPHYVLMLAPYPDPPVERWEAEEAVRAATVTAKQLDHEDFRDDVLPRLRRLTRKQREVVFHLLDPSVHGDDR